MATTGTRALPPRLPRMAELVAAQLRRRIVGGELDDGDALPREAEMLREYGVSRPSLREGLRILETEGLIHIRRGKIGGAIVHRPTAQSTAYHVGLTLQSYGATLREVGQARAVVEPACAGLAASCDAPTRRKIAKQLTELIDENERQLGDAYAFTEMALRFHQAVVDLSGNVTITVLAGALEAVWSSQERRWAQRASNADAYPDPKYQREVLRAHRKVVQAIADGDVEAATALMRGHLSRSQAYVSADHPVDVLEPAPGELLGRRA